MIELKKLEVGSRKSLFKCVYCNKVVVKETNNGRKQKSCGCIMKDLLKNGLGRTHGCSDTRLFRIWKGIKVRCYTKTHHSYPDYGMKGIKICDQWINNFVVFKKWAIKNGYNNILTIDRKNNQMDYTPDNCQWITREENSGKDKISYTEYDIHKIRWLYICCKWSKTKISNSVNVNRLRIGMIANFNNKGMRIKTPK